MCLHCGKKNSDNTSSKIGADEIGNLFIQTLNSYVRGLSLKIDSFWQKKAVQKFRENFPPIMHLNGLASRQEI